MSDLRCPRCEYFLRLEAERDEFKAIAMKAQEQFEEMAKERDALKTENTLLKLDEHMNTLANTRDIYHGEKIVELNIELEAERDRYRLALERIESEDGWAGFEATRALVPRRRPAPDANGDYPDQRIPDNRIATLEKQVGWAQQLFKKIKGQIGFSSDPARHKVTLIAIDRICDEGFLLMGPALAEQVSNQIVEKEVRTFLGEDGEEHAVAEFNKRREG